MNYENHTVTVPSRGLLKQLLHLKQLLDVQEFVNMALLLNVVTIV